MKSAHDAAMAFLEDRGLDSELAVKYGLTGMRHSNGADWLKIPYNRNGTVINHKYRALGEKAFLSDLSAERDLWNVDVIGDSTLASEPLFITEGELDALAMIQAGFVRSTSIPDGWTDGLEDAAGSAKLAVLDRNEQAIRACDRVIVASDSDSTGKSFLRAVANFFDGANIEYLAWPDDCKDANDCLKLHGVEALQRAVASARQVDPPGGLITGFSDLPPWPERRIWRINWREFDRRMAFRSREISVITGKPGSGKSTYALWYAWHLARVNDIRCGLLMFENDPGEIFEALFRACKNKPSTDAPPDEINDVKARLDRNFRVVHRVDENEVMHGMGWIQKMIHTLAARDGCSVIFIDPWNELEHCPEKGESVTDYTNVALTKLRQWAEKFDIHICVIAHPRKLQDDEVPGGYHVANSAAWANKPGLGLTIHPVEDDEAPHVLLKTWKVRSRQQTGCSPGHLKMLFNEQMMTYRPTK